MGPQWLDRGVELVVVGGCCALGVATLLAIAWVGWMLADEGRAVDYRRRVDAALHSGPPGRTRWFVAVRTEVRFAVRSVRRRIGQRFGHRTAGWR